MNVPTPTTSTLLKQTQVVKRITIGPLLQPRLNGGQHPDFAIQRTQGRLHRRRRVTARLGVEGVAARQQEDARITRLDGGGEAAGQGGEGGQVGEDDGGRGFADVPVDPKGAGGVCEAVVLPRGGAEDDEGGEGEGGGEGESGACGVGGADEEGEEEEDHGEVRGDVKGGVGDQVVGHGGAVCGGGPVVPVVCKGQAPVVEEENLHDDQGQGDVEDDGLDDEGLESGGGDAEVQAKKAGLDQPNGSDEALLDDDDDFGEFFKVVDARGRRGGDVLGGVKTGDGGIEQGVQGEGSDLNGVGDQDGVEGEGDDDQEVVWLKLLEAALMDASRCSVCMRENELVSFGCLCNKLV